MVVIWPQFGCHFNRDGLEAYWKARVESQGAAGSSGQRAVTNRPSLFFCHCHVMFVFSMFWFVYVFCFSMFLFVHVFCFSMFSFADVLCIVLFVVSPLLLRVFFTGCLGLKAPDRLHRFCCFSAVVVALIWARIWNTEL